MDKESCVLWFLHILRTRDDDQSYGKKGGSCITYAFLKNSQQLYFLCRRYGVWRTMENDKVSVLNYYYYRRGPHEAIKVSVF